MTYHPDDYYTRDRTFPLAKAEEVTVRTLARWAQGFEARVRYPVKGARKRKVEGALPEGVAERQDMAVRQWEWARSSTQPESAFAFYLFREYPKNPRGDRATLFDHAERSTAATWALELEPSEFGELQKALQENGLPADFFFPHTDYVVIPFRLFGRIPFGDMYHTPLAWKNRNKNS